MILPHCSIIINFKQKIWNPNQLRLNGRLNENHLLRFSEGLDDSVVDQHYGEDRNCRVVVQPVEIISQKEISDYILQRIDVNRPSNKAGVDVHADVLALAVQNLEEYTFSYTLSFRSTFVLLIKRV